MGLMQIRRSAYRRTESNDRTSTRAEKKVSLQMRGQDGCLFSGIGATLGVENRTGIRTPSVYEVLGIVGCRIRVILLRDVGPKNFD